MTGPLLEVDGLSRRFDVSRPWLERTLTRTPRQLLHAVTEVSFAIDRGETFALVGESGSGKSTIARMVVGLMPPSAGRVRFGGVEISAAQLPAAERRQLRRRLAMVFQDPYASLNPLWRVADIIAEPIRAHAVATGEPAIATRVAELLALVGLAPADGIRYPHAFSGGQRQRIAIARALAAEPAFIVCDEPTSALDVSVQAQILNLMRDVQDRFGLAYLLISHNLAVVRHMARRVGVLYLGRLVEIAPAQRLFGAPRHPYTRMLLDAVPRMHGSVGRVRAVTGEIASPLDPPPGCAFHPRCPLADQRCRQETPTLARDGDTLVACHAVAEGRG